MSTRRSDPPADPSPENRQERAEDTKLPEPPVEAVEMGGEAPCQLPRVWDADE